MSHSLTRGDLHFLAEASVRYHGERAAHFERLAKGLTIVTLVCGAGAFVTAFGTIPYLAPAAGLFVTVVNGYRLVGKPDECAARQRQWLNRWQDILGEILARRNHTLTGFGSNSGPPGRSILSILGAGQPAHGLRTGRR